MFTKIQYNIQVITREVDEKGNFYPHGDKITQRAIINEQLSFDEQIKAAKILVEQVMKNLRAEHEKIK